MAEVIPQQTSARTSVSKNRMRCQLTHVFGFAREKIGTNL